MISVIIPARNEGSNIEKVLEKIPEHYDVIVVSGDESSKEVVEKYGFRLLVVEKKGKGIACREGAKLAKHEYIVFIDGDGQLDAGEIPKFVNALKNADVVLGQRDFSKIPWQRQLSNKYARWSIKKITGKKFDDVLCGFRAIKKHKFMELGLEKNGYEFESEMIIKAGKKNLMFETVPISVRYDLGERMPMLKSAKVAGYITKEALKKTLRIK